MLKKILLLQCIVFFTAHASEKDMKNIIQHRIIVDNQKTQEEYCMPLVSMKSNVLVFKLLRCAKNLNGSEKGKTKCVIDAGFNSDNQTLDTDQSKKMYKQLRARFKKQQTS